MACQGDYCLDLRLCGRINVGHNAESFMQISIYVQLEIIKQNRQTMCKTGAKLKQNEYMEWIAVGKIYADFMDVWIWQLRLNYMQDCNGNSQIMILSILPSMLWKFNGQFVLQIIFYGRKCMSSQQ